MKLEAYKVVKVPDEAMTHFRTTWVKGSIVRSNSLKKQEMTAVSGVELETSRATVYSSYTYYIYFKSLGKGAS